MSRGGKRPGAGGKRKPPAQAPEGATMLQFLVMVATGQLDATAVQVRAAIAALRFGADDDTKTDPVEDAAKGLYAPSSVPLRLVVSKEDKCE